MVTHETRAASVAQRIMFLADGLIVKELAEASPGEVLEVMSTLQS
jgi:putative ABC transport system ATP-binding protein